MPNDSKAKQSKKILALLPRTDKNLGSCIMKCNSLGERTKSKIYAYYYKAPVSSYTQAHKRQKWK